MWHQFYLYLAGKLYFPTSKYFRFFARIVLKSWHPKIIAIIGSAGKSNAHKLFSDIIQRQYPIRKSQKANSAFAIPLDVLDIHITRYSPSEWLMAALLVPFKTLYLWLWPFKERFYLVELDVDRPGEMTFFASFIKPFVVFWVSSYATHTANFDRMVKQHKFSSSAEAVAAEFAKIFGRSHKTIAFLNGDSVFIRRAMKSYKVRKYWISQKNGQYRITNWAIFRRRTAFNLKLAGQKQAVELPLIAPRNFGYTLVAVLLLAKILKIDQKDVKASLASFNFNPGICTLLEGFRHSRIIDSSYNSSFYATKSLLEVLHCYPGPRKIAVLGDMRELGQLSESEHRNLGKTILKYHFNQVVLVGPQLKQYVYPILKKIYTETTLHQFDNTYQAGLFIKERLLKNNDVLLLKASQNTLFFEIIAELLLDNPADSALLCRRGSVWENKREQIKNEFYVKLQ